MALDLKSILHYYLGCVGYGASGCAIVLTPANLQLVLLGEVEFKPILRTLDSLSDSERLHMMANFPAIDKDNTLPQAVKDAMKLYYLFSKHIDLFNLIERGLAVSRIPSISRINNNT